METSQPRERPLRERARHQEFVTAPARGERDRAEHVARGIEQQRPRARLATRLSRRKSAVTVRSAATSSVYTSPSMCDPSVSTRWVIRAESSLIDEVMVFSSFCMDTVGAFASFLVVGA